MFTPLLLLSCLGASPVVGETASEGETWWVALEQTRYDQGDAELILWVSALADGHAAPGLAVMLRGDMPGMGHSGEVVHLDDQGDGSYVGLQRFHMPGLWTITGYVGDEEGLEAYTLTVEVSP